MQIFNSSQIKLWDAYTIAQEPISSIDLMERASRKVFDWLMEHGFSEEKGVVIFCGSGNNGGDGLAVARMLWQSKFSVKVFLFQHGTTSTNCRVNLDRLEAVGCPVHILTEVGQMPDLPEDFLVLDALFGTGLSRPLEGAAAELVEAINKLPNRKVSVDLPSGLPADTLLANASTIQADVTLTFQSPKLSFFFPEHAAFTGEWHVLPIELHAGFEESENSTYTFVDEKFIEFFKPATRQAFTHKGDYGHALLHGGSAGMMGALIMSLRACLRSGVGLVTAAPPDEQQAIIQSTIPEAMCGTSSLWMHHAWYERKTAVGAGMGWREDDYHAKLLQWLVCNISAPLLLDAGALNLLSSHMEWLDLRPAGSPTIITPHPGEFARMAGVSANSILQLEKAREMASRYNMFVVLKGAYTKIVTPGGLIYFNSTGNPGMAKGGSGDVLAGLLTGLLAQGMSPVIACLLGVYVHGLAGDLAAATKTQIGMTPSDLLEYLPSAWQKITS